jgi:class 3 adenylate cyclase
MNYDKLSPAYWRAQMARVEAMRARIRDREDAIANGRVVPDGGDLAIGTGRRLPMAVMFIDIVDFSQRASESADEQRSILSALNLFFSEMTRVAEDYGGEIEKHTGDGLMIYFADNAGDPPEGGCKRAMACALTMMAARDHLLDPIFQRNDVRPLAFRIGMDYGHVTIARMGIARGFNAVAAIGTTANLASKIMRFAGENEIVIGELALNQLPELWRIAFSRSVEEPSGWVYNVSGTPYPVYRYHGRWVLPEGA